MDKRAFTSDATNSRPVIVVALDDFASWLDGQDNACRAWLSSTGFTPKAGAFSLLPGSGGAMQAALYISPARATAWDAASIRDHVPNGSWRIEDRGHCLAATDLVYGWGLASYRFERYRAMREDASLLVVEAEDRAQRLCEAVWLARDLVNTPANDLGPDNLQAAIEAMAARFDAGTRAIVGDELLAQNYPMIHAVGRASATAPRLVDLRWGSDPARPLLTLVGKGVCFDTGGLDIKPSAAMLLMKKDMGGAALTIALAHAVMSEALPVRLRLLVPAVENSISAGAFRPGDVLQSRKGLNVEIGNTDAEGRLVLADALVEADSEAPDLLLDAATLTGAARVALGPELPVMFSTDEGFASTLMSCGQACADPLARLPLHEGYRKMLDSRTADINNTGAKPFAGAITAALFLKEFVSDTRNWVHLDVFGWNDEARPGRPRGGEASGFRAVFNALAQRYER